MLPLKINPLEPGLVWIRGMDMEPVLTTEVAIEGYRDSSGSCGSALRANDDHARYGASGFVGGAFVARAEKVFDVRCVSRDNSRRGDIHWDITAASRTRFRSSTVVVHIASLTARERPDRNPRSGVPAAQCRRHAESPESSLVGARLRALRKHCRRLRSGTRRARFGGHAAAPAWRICAEKLEAEQTALAYCASHGIPCGVARLGLTYGPGEVGYKKVIPSFVERALAGEKLCVFGEGRAKRQFLYVDDLVSALLLMVRLKFQGVLNVVGARVTTVGELATLIAGLAGLTTRRRACADGWARTRHPVRHLRARELGFLETVALEDGLRRQIEWQRGR